MEKYIIRNDIPPAKINHNWPFKFMKRGESIIIENKKEWPRAVRAAHAYSNNYYHADKPRFMTRWAKEDNRGIIWRIF